MTATNPEISEELRERRERVFLVLAGFFLCAMTMLNIIGITRFIQLGPLALAVGVLPYPLTFLCTDLISEIYGRARANFMVTVGLILNFFIIGTMWLASAMPSVAPDTQPPWQLIQLAEDVALPNGDVVSNSVELFSLLYATTTGAVIASMFAYIAAQYCDVYMFHFWKRLTQGKHLWLRNNGSTMVSQLVDTTAVILITHFYARALPIDASQPVMGQLAVYIASGYVFKLIVAALDTLPFYLGVAWLRDYLEIDPTEMHED